MNDFLGLGGEETRRRGRGGRVRTRETEEV